MREWVPAVVIRLLAKYLVASQVVVFKHRALDLDRRIVERYLPSGRLLPLLVLVVGLARVTLPGLRLLVELL